MCIGDVGWLRQRLRFCPAWAIFDQCASEMQGQALPPACVKSELSLRDTRCSRNTSTTTETSTTSQTQAWTRSSVQWTTSSRSYRTTERLTIVSSLLQYTDAVTVQSQSQSLSYIYDAERVWVSYLAHFPWFSSGFSLWFSFKIKSGRVHRRCSVHLV